MSGTTRPLKILHILDHSAPLQSGYVFRSQSIFREQVKRGWQPVALSSPKHEASSQDPWQEVQEIAGIRYYRTGKTSSGILPLEAELRIMWALARRIKKVAEVEKPQLIHAHSPILNAFPSFYAGRKLRIPVVYEIRAFWEDAAVDHGTFAEGSVRYNLIRSSETWACKMAQHTVVLCEGIREDLHKRGIPLENLTAIRNGVDVESLAPCLPDAEYLQSWNLANKRVIGFIGSFYRYEGLDLLVEAFGKLADRYPQLVLLLLGGGEVEGELREQVQRLGLEHRVLLPGRIPHSRVPGVYSLMEALVYPRRSMRLTELVTPLKPLEAMAMRKPVIASNIGGHRELLRDGETGLLFKPGDASSLAQSIGRLLDEPLLRDNLAGRGREWVLQEHSWGKTTSAYAEIYQQALDRFFRRFEAPRLRSV